MIISGKIQQWGNSFGIRIPKSTAKKLNLRKDTTIILDIQETSPNKGFGMFRGATSFQREKDDDVREWP